MPRPQLDPTVSPKPGEESLQAEHTSADTENVAYGSTEPLSNTSVDDTDEQSADPCLQADADQSQLWRQEPTASKEARWIVHIEVCAAGAAEPRERRAFVYPQRVTFGRGEGCDIRFDAEERTVSSLHAKLLRTDSGYVLRDADSRNGLFLLSQGLVHDPSQGLATPASGRELDSAAPAPLAELQLEVSAQPTEISLGPQGPICRIRIGDVIPFADYLVTGRLGEGGMATVFVAQETTGLSRLVVLKLIAPSLLMSIDQKDAEAMLQEEARIASQISHPNVVNIFRAGCYQGSHYIAMEYLRGVNLGSIQRQLVRRRRRCPADLAAALVSQALLGLHAAHEAKDAGGRSLGIVHRDFTPTNIVCSPDGDVKLIDFGVARAIGRCHLSATGQFVGKPAYASPEQIQRPKTIDRRSDVFAAGIILYELCTGKPLFLRDHDFATMAAVIAEPIPPLAGIPDPLAEIIVRALSRDPQDRPPTAEALAEQLERFVLAESGRYLQRKNIAHSLRRLGVNLIAPTPRTLVGRPTLFPRPSKRIRRTSQPPHGSQPVPELSANGPPPSPPEDDKTRHDIAPVAELPAQVVLGAASYSLISCLEPCDCTSALPHAVYSAVPAEPPQAESLAAAAAPSRLYRLHIIGSGALNAPLPEPHLGRMRSFVEGWRAADPERCPLGPIVAAEPAWAGGPFALLLPTHPDERSLQALQQSAIPYSTRLLLAHKLALALHEAVRLRPGFVHGELTPAQIMVRPEPLPRLWLRLPMQLAGVLGSSETTPAAAGGAEGADAAIARSQRLTTYTAPECLNGAACTPSSDVFSCAAIVFELLGGDLAQAAHALRSGSRIPSLPPSAHASAELLEALRAALSPEPERRPILSELLRCLAASADKPPAVQVPAGRAANDPAPELPLPDPESRCALIRPDGGRLHLYALQLDHCTNRGPFLLPLSRVSGLLAAPVSISLYRNTLIVELSAHGDTAHARLRLYPEGVESGKARLFLDPDGSAFELGSRTQNVLQRIEYKLPSDEEHDLAALPVLGLKLRLPRRGRAAFLWTRDLRSGELHVCCVQIAE